MPQYQDISLFKIYKNQIIKHGGSKTIIWINVDIRYSDLLQAQIIENTCKGKTLILDRLFFKENILPHFSNTQKYFSTLKKVVDLFRDKKIFIQVEFYFFRSLIDLINVISKDENNKTYTVYIMSDNYPFIFFNHNDIISIVDIHIIPYCVLSANNSSVIDYINYGHIHSYFPNIRDKNLFYKDYENRLFCSLGYIATMSAKRDLSFFITVYSFMCYCCIHKLHPTWNQFQSYIACGNSYDVKKSFFNKWVDAMDIMLYPIPEFYILPLVTQILFREPHTYKGLVFVKDITALSYFNEFNHFEIWLCKEYNMLHHHLKAFQSEFELGHWWLFKKKYLSICYLSVNKTIIHHIIVNNLVEANILKKIIEEQSGADLLFNFEQKYKILILDDKPSYAFIRTNKFIIESYIKFISLPIQNDTF